MQTSANRMRQMWAEGRPTVGGWSTLGSAFATEIMATAGFDYVCVDLQHGLSDFDSLGNMLTAAARTGVTTLVRVPFNFTPFMGEALDAGADGVIIPMVNSREEAERAVRGAKYAPMGVRSFGPVRSSLFTGGATPDEVNAETLCLVMVETREAVERIDEICSTPGIDGIYIGAADLAISYELPPYGDPAPEALARALERIKAACAAHGLPVGTHAGSGEHAHRCLDDGYQMVTVATDASLLRAKVLADLAVARGSAADASARIY